IITLLYVGAGVLVIVRNGGLFVEALKGIVHDAFNVKAAAGGFIGRGLHETISKGMSRGVYSNEAGWGTSAMIHSTASTNHPIEIGLCGVIEVFFDTIVICFITGIVVVMGLLSGVSSGGDIVVTAFSLGIGELSKVIIPITIFSFGLTTSIGWYSYYESIILFFYTRGKKKFNMEKLLKNMKRIYPIPGFIIVVITATIGGAEGTLWAFADILAGIPTFVNMFVVLLLSDKFFELLQDYKEKHILGEKSEIIPIFYGQEDHNYYNF
ncbi:MAG: alanine:cation symporter family protein, partial [Clostridium sp.]